MTVKVRINVLLDCAHRPRFLKNLEILRNLGLWTQSKSTFILIIILHRHNPIEFTVKVVP
jgi:hypothetical protein